MRSTFHGPRGWSRAGLLLALLLPLTAGAAGVSVDELGTVRNDTLVVSRDRVIAAALAHNEMLAAADAMADAAGADALSAWRGFLPHVSLGAYRVRSNDPLYAFGFKLNQRNATMADMAAPPMGDAVNHPGVGENNITQIKIQQPVFNGGMSLFGKKAADAMARAARYDHRRAEETVRFQAVQAYEGLVLARAYQRVMERALASAEGHLKQAQAMVDNGLATQADLLQARAYRDGVRQKLIEMRNMVATAGENIKLLAAVDTDLPIAPDPADVEATPDTTVAAILDGAGSRSDVQALREKAAAAAAMVKVARGSLLPHLNLQAEKDWYAADTFLGNDADSWVFGIYATWDIFSGLQNVGALKKARAQSRAAGHAADFQSRRARTEAVQAALDLRAAREKLNVAREAVAAAREGLRIMENMYREGLTSMVDLLDVQAGATMAEGNLVQAEHDLRVAMARVEFTGGTLAAADNGETSR